MPKVTLLHGFTQTGASWDVIAAALRHEGFEVAAPDLPGHGARSEVRADLWDAARVALDEGGTSTYIGYSMGGRVALHAALLAPQAVEQLVLVSTTAGLDDPGERAARRRADDELAAEIERDGVAAFLDRWLAGPLFATLPAAAAGRAQRAAASTPEGLASSLRLAGTGAMEPLWDRLPELATPVALVAGALDEKFRALAERMAATIGAGARCIVLPGAGHACHLEQPDAFVAQILPLLRGPHERARPSA